MEFVVVLTHFLMIILAIMFTLMRKNVHKKFLMAAVPYVLGQHYTIIVGLNAHRNRKTMIFPHVVYAPTIKDRIDQYIIVYNLRIKRSMI